MDQQIKLIKRLEDMQGTIRGIFPGTNPNATPEQVAKEINRALDQIEAGDFEEVEA